MELETELVGFKLISRKMNKLNSDLKDRLARKAVSEVGTHLRRIVVRQVPIETQTLKKNIVKRVKSNKFTEYYYTKVTVKESDSHPRAYKTPVPRQRRRRRSSGGYNNSVYNPNNPERYYRFVETGTKYHNATPFLTPALEDNTEELERMVGNLIWQGMEAVLK